jgi:von Willebrand factor type A C-terminal domain/von Willebrand factor type A domain
MTEPGFAIEVFQNQYLPDGGRDVNAIVTVTSDGTPGPAPIGAYSDRAEIIIVDCSGSMGAPDTKIAEARVATSAAVDAICDGVAFGIICGTDVAVPVFPETGGMAVASAQNRQLAKRAVSMLRPGGGTAMGQWLRLAHATFASYPAAALRHAILLTDGKNQHESPAELSLAIKLCEGSFGCDCRGVGTDWEVSELRRISTALFGSVDIVPDPAGLAADFAGMMGKAMAKRLADVSLRLWTPQHASVRFVKQVAPDVDDLTGRAEPAGQLTTDYPTGAWGDGESRDYHVCVRVTPGAVGQEMLAARVSIVAGSPSSPEVLGQGLVRAVWTEDEALSTRMSRHVAHYTGQAELARVIQEGLDARKSGDEGGATAKLGRAVALAEESGNVDTAKLLARVVDVVDAPTGTVRLKKKVQDADEMALDTRSTRTVRTRK